MEIAFRRYRAMAITTGTTLLVLCVVFIVHKGFVQQWNAWHWLHVVDRVIGIGHGIVLYPIYLVTCFQLVLKARIKLWTLPLMMLAGFIPGLAFVVERSIGKSLAPRSVS